MNFAAAMTAIHTHLTAAGAAITPVIKDIARASPVPKGRCIRYWWAGDTEPVKMGGRYTLNSEMAAELVRIVAYFPLSTLGEQVTEQNDTEVRALRQELYTRLLGDSQLGGAVTDLSLVERRVDWEIVGDARYRTLDLTVALDFTEFTIAP